MKTIFEQQGVEYRQAGDYMLPNVGMGEQKEYQIGVWGQRYKRHLKSNHRVMGLPDWKRVHKRIPRTV